MRLMKLFYVLFLSSLSGYSQAEDNFFPKKYMAYYTDEVLEIDGYDKEDSWQHVVWSENFIDIEGIYTPKFKTAFKMRWNETYFYVLAKLEEPHIWATLRQKDTIIFYNNDFEIFIDPDGDTHNYYELEVNALNTNWDLFITKPYREGNQTINDYTLKGLKTAIRIEGTLNNPNDTDNYWTLEMAIPWSAFKTSYFDKNIPKDKFWRINFSRVNWDHQIENGTYSRKKDTNGKFLPEYNWVWSPMGVVNMHEPEKWGYVYFSTKLPSTSTSFAIPNDDKIKWELYKIHHHLKAYYRKNKSYPSNFDELSNPVFNVDSIALKPTIEYHSTGYNIIVRSPFTNKILIVKEDGKFLLKN